jgi:hypothetical protein
VGAGQVRRVHSGRVTANPRTSVKGLPSADGMSRPATSTPPNELKLTPTGAGPGAGAGAGEGPHLPSTCVCWEGACVGRGAGGAQRLCASAVSAVRSTLDTLAAPPLRRRIS